MMKRLALPLLLLAVFGLLGVCAGSRWLDPREFHTAAGWNPLFELRLLRVATAFTVGGCLALSGMVFQAVLRNPLAEPFTLGISGGASVGAALAFLTGLTAASFLAVPAGAFLGAVGVLALVLWISGGGRRGSESLLLSGVIAGTIASSVLMFLLSIARNDELAGITWWMLGDLQSADPALLWPGLLFSLVAAAVLTGCADRLNAISLGDETAFYLGVNPKFDRPLLVALASLLAAATVTLAGIVGFCGLIVPHIVRKFCGSDHRKSVLPIFLWGAAFLTGCDLLSRAVWPEREIPIGVVTSLIGGPVFLWMLNRRKPS